jgi:type IV pilus assembly protein PilM
MVFEISEAGIAAARIGARTEVEFHPLKSGVISVSPLKENILDHDEFILAVRALVPAQKRKDVALILPDYCTRMTVLDFDNFPADPKEQASLVRFRVKRSVPFDADTAALSYFPQPAANKRVDVVVVIAPLEIVARYESPFRAAGMNPGLVTTSGIAALDLAPEAGLSVIAKLSGRVLTLLVRDKAALKMVRCLELPSASLEDIVSVLVPTFVYVEDNLGGEVQHLLLCGFGPQLEEEARQRVAEELRVAVEPLRSPLAAPGENNAGLLGYLRSIAKNN